MTTLTVSHLDRIRDLRCAAAQVSVRLHNFVHLDTEALRLLQGRYSRRTITQHLDTLDHLITCWSNNP